MTKRHRYPFAAIWKGTTYAQLRNQGWDTLKNGELLAAAEADGFDVLLTTDKNMPYQQNLAGRKIAVVVLGLQQWPSLRLSVGRVVEAIEAAIPGSYTVIEFPSEPRRSHPEHGS